jgi:hypothetical protein
VGWQDRRRLPLCAGGSRVRARLYALIKAIRERRRKAFRVSPFAHHRLRERAYARIGWSASTRVALGPSCNRAGVTGGGQRECDRRFANRSLKAQCRQIRQRRMEPLWSPVVATGGNPSQIGPPRNPQTYAKPVAGGCDLLPESFHGKEGVDGSSPSEGSAKAPHNGAFWYVFSRCGGL